MTISKDDFLEHAEHIGLSINDVRRSPEAFINYNTDPKKFFVRFSHNFYNNRVHIEWFLCGYAPHLTISADEFLALTERDINLLTDQMINVHAASSIIQRKLETIKEDSKQYFRNVIDSASK